MASEIIDREKRPFKTTEEEMRNADIWSFGMLHIYYIYWYITYVFIYIYIYYIYIYIQIDRSFAVLII